MEGSMKSDGWTYVIYDTQDNDLPVFQSDSIKEIAKYFGLKKRVVSSEICRGALIRRRYRVLRVYPDGRTYSFGRSSPGWG